MATTYRVPPPDTFSQNLLSTVTGGFDDLAQAYALGDTYLIGSNIVNSFRLTVNRTALHRYAAEGIGPADVGIKTFSTLPHFLVLSVTGQFSLGNNTQSEATFRTTSYQTGDDINVI